MEQVLNILSELHPEVDFGVEDSLVDDNILDSFDIISIIATANEQFDVSISAEDITPENFNSVEAIYAMIERLK